MSRTPRPCSTPTAPARASKSVRKCCATGLPRFPHGPSLTWLTRSPVGCSRPMACFTRAAPSMACKYVFDGLPLLDNRSPNFAPTLDIEEFQSMVIRTGGYPAEYGRQLGGVIEVATTRDSRPGLHGKATAGGGSFGTASGSFDAQYGFAKDTVGVTADGMTTGRYLDPPVMANYTNHGSGAGARGSWERNWNRSDRSRFDLRRNRVASWSPTRACSRTPGRDRTAPPRRPAARPPSPTSSRRACCWTCEARRAILPPGCGRTRNRRPSCRSRTAVSGKATSRPRCR